jgi:hypothetical protein
MLKKKHKAAQRGVERPGDRDVIVGRHNCFDVAITRDLCPGASGLDRTCFAIDSDDKTRVANGVRK